MAAGQLGRTIGPAVATTIVRPVVSISAQAAPKGSPPAPVTISGTESEPKRNSAIAAIFSANRANMTVREINKPIAWKGKALSGVWSVTLKIDGVRAIWDETHIDAFLRTFPGQRRVVLTR